MTCNGIFNHLKIVPHHGSNGKLEVQGVFEVNGVAFSAKADCVSGATAGDLATLDASGNLADSGKSVANSVTDTDNAVPTSGAVVDYVENYVGRNAEPAWNTGVFALSGGGNAVISALNRYQYFIDYAVTGLTVTCGAAGIAESLIKLTFADGFDPADIELNTLSMTGDDCNAGTWYPVAGKTYYLRLYRFADTTAGKWAVGMVAAVSSSADPVLPVLIVTAPEGATVTATNGVETLTAGTAGGIATFYLPATGNWVISGDYAGTAADATVTVPVSVVQTYTAALTFTGVTVYGVRHYKTLPSPELQRLGDAAGKTFTAKKVVETSPGVYSTTQPGSSSFDTAAIYRDIKQCAMSGGAVIAYEDDPRFSYTGKHGASVVVASGAETGVKMIIALNGANFDVSTYYNGTLVNTQTTTDAYGGGLTTVTTDGGTITFPGLRTASLVEGTFYMSGGTSSAQATLSVNEWPFATAGSVGTWANGASSGMAVSTYYNGVLVNTQNTNSTGSTLVNVTTPAGVITYNTARSAALVAGTYNLSGGSDSAAATADCNSELLATAGSNGTWPNYATSDDLMVEIPRYYLKIEDTDTTTTIWISNAKGEGFIVSPGHAARGSEQNDRSVIYLSRYALDSSYRSKSGVAIKDTGGLIQDLKPGMEAVAALGTGYYSLDYSAWLSVVYLYLVEVANLNSQAAIGKGYPIGDPAWSAVLANGVTDPLGYHSGTVSPYGGAGTDYGAVAYRGIEGLWGNANWVIAGIRYNTSDDKFYLCNNPDDNIPASATDWTNYTPSLSATSGGYLVSVHYDLETGIMLPVNAGSSGSSSTYFCDYVSSLTTTLALAFGFATRAVGTARMEYCGLFELVRVSGANALRSMILP